ncbi:hypothetical protein [Streptomyces noursei]|uniref:hypothetical protein n=1 Tax=Streptomyces noursei TaxID=1971 RepID=UPI0023B827BE|nr:hypothetical protein [Streptomyces noursei]
MKKAPYVRISRTEYEQLLDNLNTATHTAHQQQQRITALELLCTHYETALRDSRYATVAPADLEPAL